MKYTKQILIIVVAILTLQNAFVDSRRMSMKKSSKKMKFSPSDPIATLYQQSIFNEELDIIENNVECFSMFVLGFFSAWNKNVHRETITVYNKIIKNYDHMKLICPDCGKQYESGKFCLECGAKLQEVAPELVCPSCGFKAKTGNFCPECGTKLTEQVVASEPQKCEETVERKFNEKDERFAKYYDNGHFIVIIVTPAGPGVQEQLMA